MNSLKRITCVVLIVFVFAALAAPASAWQPDDVVGILPKRLQPLLEEDPGSGPSELGGLVADCVRWVAQTDLAIVPAGDLEQDLPVGEVRWEDVTRAVNEDRQLAEAEITPAQLYALLEELLSHLSVDLADESLDVEASAFAGFPQVSGFLLTVDASAPAGERAYAVTLEDGTVLDREDESTLLTMASTEHLISGGYGPTAVDVWTSLNQNLGEVRARALGSGEIVADDLNRIRIIGVSGTALIHSFPLPVVIVVLLVIALCCVLLHCKQRSKRDVLPMWEGETRRHS